MEKSFLYDINFFLATVRRMSYYFVVCFHAIPNIFI